MSVGKVEVLLGLEFQSNTAVKKVKIGKVMRRGAPELFKRKEKANRPKVRPSKRVDKKQTTMLV